MTTTLAGGSTRRAWHGSRVTGSLAAPPLESTFVPTPPRDVSRRAFVTGALSVGAAALVAACARQDPSASAAADGATTSTTSAPASSAGGTATASTAGSTASSSSPSSSTSSNGSSTPTSAGGPVTARFVDHADGAGSNIALTFHTNGDLKQVQQLFDALGSHHVVATCFIVGNWLEANPSWAKRFTDAGHELANHTYTHPDFTKLSAAAMATE